MGDTNTVEMLLKVTPQGLELFDQAGKKVADLGRAAKEAEQGFSLFSAKGAAAAVAVGGLATAVTGFAVAAGAAKAGMDAFTVGVARGSAFNDLSQRLGVSVETLSKLELAAKTSGVSLDGLGVGIQQLSRNMVEAASGGKEAQAAFAALGISAAELKSLNTEQVLGKIADSFAGANDGAAKTAIAMQLLGRAGAQMIPLLNEGSAGLQRFGELSERLGLTMTRDMAAAFDSIGDSMDILGSAVEGVQSQFAIGMAPALAEVSEALVGLVADMGIANGTIRGLGETVGGWLKGAFESLRGTIEETQGLFATLDFEDAMGIVGERLNKALESAFESAIWAAARAAKNVFMTAVEWAFGSVDISSVVASKNEELIREQVGNLERELSARYGSGGLEAARVDAPFDANVRNLVDNVDALKGRLGELAGAQLVAQAAASKNSAAMVDQQVAGNLAALGVNTAGDAWRFYEQAGVSAGKTNLSAPLKDTGDAAKKLGEDLQNASAALSAAQGIYEQAADGSITLAEANLRAAAASAVLAKGVTDEKAVMAALAIERQKAAIEATKETAAAVEAAAASERRVAILDEAIAAGLSSAEAEQLLAQATIEAHAADILATTGIADKAEKYRQAAEAARASAQAEKDRQAILSAQNRVQDLQLELSLTQQVNQGLISELDKKIAIARAQADGNVELEKRLVMEVELREAIEDQQTAYVHLGDVFKDSFEQAFDAVISGTRSIGIGIGKRLFSAMLDSKFKDFDPTVKANFLDLGEFGKSIFGDLFSGDSGVSGGSSSGSGDGLFKQAADWIGGLFSGASSSYGPTNYVESSSGVDLGLTTYPTNFVETSSGASVPSTGGGPSGGGGGGFSFGGALAGGASGYASSSSFGSMLITGTGLPAALTQVEGQVVNRLRGINQVVSTVLGAVFGGLMGGEGGEGGGLVGMIFGLFDSLVGQSWGDQVNRDVLRDRGFGGGGLGAWTPRIAGGLDSGSWDLVGATDPLASWVMFQLLGLPTLGTAFRQAGEGVIDSSPTFGGDNGKGGLQGLLGDWTRTGYATGEQTALDRGFSQSQVDAVSGGTQAIFSQLFKDSLPEDAGRLAEEQGQIMAEFLSRGLAEGLTYDQLFASLRQFAGEAGVTLKSAVEGLSRGFEQAKASAMEFGNLDPMAAGKQAADSYAQSLYGVTQVFKGDFPLGVNLASIALQTMEKDGVKAFENLDHNGKETLQNLTEDSEAFQAVVAHLAEQGFTINTEEFEAKLQAITESATFLGQNIGQIFNFDSAAAGVDAIFQQLKGDIFSTFQGEAMKQLFNGTDIAAAFEPVYAVLDRIDEFDLTTATGSQEFMAQLVPALAQGRANLEAYLPVLQVMIDNWKEIQKVIDEAMKPDVFEQAAIVAEEGFNGIGGALTDAIDAGVAVLEDGGTWDDAVKAFDQTFGAGVTKSFQDAIFKAIVQSAVIDPLIATYQPAFAYVVAAGLEYGFQDPRVKQAFGILMGDVRSKAEELGLIVFQAKVDSDGITSDIERAFNDAADVTTKWADDFRNAVWSGLDSAFDVLKEGGSRDEAIAAWEKALNEGTYNSVLDAIARAMIDAALIEPFIKRHAPEMQYIVAGAIANGWDDPRVQEAIDKVFGPDSQFKHELSNLAPVAIDIWGTIVLPDGTRIGPGDGTGGSKKPTDGEGPDGGSGDTGINTTSGGATGGLDAVAEPAQRAAEGLGLLADAVSSDVGARITDGVASLAEGVGDSELTVAIGEGLAALGGALTTDATGQIRLGIELLGAILGPGANLETIGAGIAKVRAALGDGEGATGLTGAVTAAVGAFVGGAGLVVAAGLSAAALGSTGTAQAAQAASVALGGQLAVAAESVAGSLSGAFLAGLGAAADGAQQLGATLANFKIPTWDPTTQQFLFRKDGGPVPAGATAVVGEEGPELMVAHAGGGATIIPLKGVPMMANGGTIGGSAGGGVIPLRSALMPLSSAASEVADALVALAGATTRTATSAEAAASGLDNVANSSSATAETSGLLGAPHTRRKPPLGGPDEPGYAPITTDALEPEDFARIDETWKGLTGLFDRLFSSKDFTDKILNSDDVNASDSVLQLIKQLQITAGDGKAGPQDPFLNGENGPAGLDPGYLSPKTSVNDVQWYAKLLEEVGQKEFVDYLHARRVNAELFQESEEQVVPGGGLLPPVDYLEYSDKINKFFAEFGDDAHRADIGPMDFKVRAEGSLTQWLDPSKIKSSVSLSLDQAVNEFAAGGSVDSMRDSITKSVNKSMYDGLVQGMISALAVEDQQAILSAAVTDAMSDGFLDASDVDSLKALAGDVAGDLSSSVEAMGPAFQAIAEAFGIDLQDSADTLVLDPDQMKLAAGALGPAILESLGDTPEKVSEALTKAAKKAATEIGSSISGSLGSLLDDPSKLNFETFSQNLRANIYQSVAEGLIDAFVQSAVIQGALAPMMGAISLIFDQIGKKQLMIAEANGLLVEQVGLISGVLNDPAFKATMETLIGGIADLRSAFGITLDTTGDLANGFSDVADQAQNACAGECEWERRLVEGQEKNATLGEFGRQGYEAVETYGPVKPDNPGRHGGSGTTTDDGSGGTYDGRQGDWKPPGGHDDTGGTGGPGNAGNGSGNWSRPGWHRVTGGPGTFDGGSGHWSRPGWDPRSDLASNAAANSGPVLVQDDGIEKLQREVAKLREAIANMPPPVVNLDGREISKNSRKHERRESRGGQSTQWGIS